MNKANFLSYFANLTTGIFKTGQNRGIGSDDFRDLVTKITDNILFKDDDAFVRYTGTTTELSVNNYAVSLSPAPTAYTNTHVYFVKFASANTGAATLNINSLGALSITKNGASALASGDIVSGQTYALSYNGTSLTIVGKIVSVLDEDDFASDSAEKVPSQQSTKAFVLNKILANTNSINWKTSVKAATTAALPANTATTTTLTANANGAFQNQDGIAIALNDYVLVKNEATASKNGIYELTQVGDAGTPWILTRRSDMDETTEFQNAVVSVDQGTVNADTSWRQTTDNVTVGTSNVVWTSFLNSAIYSATASGTNTYTASASPAITAYSAWQIFTVKFTNANTGAATLNFNSLGAKSIVKNGSTALASGDISAGQIYMLIYDGTNLQIVGRISGTTTSTSGTYTPTLTNEANIDSSTAYVCQYMRVGDVVTVSGRVDIDPTASATATTLAISLPIASNLANDGQCAGTAFKSNLASDQSGAAILGDITNNRAQLVFYSNTISNKSFFFTFTYLVI